MEIERTPYEDARIARDRSLAAVSSAKDFETQRSLWRAALKFNERMKAAGDATGCAPRHSAARLGALSAAEM